MASIFKSIVIVLGLILAQFYELHAETNFNHHYLGGKVSVFYDTPSQGGIKFALSLRDSGERVAVAYEASSALHTVLDAEFLFATDNYPGASLIAGIDSNDLSAENWIRSINIGFDTFESFSLKLGFRLSGGIRPEIGWNVFSVFIDPKKSAS